MEKRNSTDSQIPCIVHNFMELYEKRVITTRRQSIVHNFVENVSLQGAKVPTLYSPQLCGKRFITTRCQVNVIKHFVTEK